MHESAHSKVADAVRRYLPEFEQPRVLDFGSRMVAKQALSHRQLFDDVDCTYVGTDVVEGPNVDVVMPEPYTLPFADDSFQMIISGQVIEHIPYPWISMMELGRILAPDGALILTAPSRGHVHNPPYDCWRFYPDSFRALATFAGLSIVELATDLPPTRSEASRYLDYGAIDDTVYWGDCFGVFRKDATYPENELREVRHIMQRWANNRSALTEVMT